MQRQLLCLLMGIRGCTLRLGRSRSRDGPEHPQKCASPIPGTSQAGASGCLCTASLQPFPCQVPFAEPGRGMEPLSPGPVLFTACSASSPQGTETAGPYETVAMNIQPDLLTARTLGPSGIHPLGNTTRNLRAVGILAGWGCCPSLHRVRDARIALPASERACHRAAMHRLH